VVEDEQPDLPSRDAGEVGEHWVLTVIEGFASPDPDDRHQRVFRAFTKRHDMPRETGQDDLVRQGSGGCDDHQDPAGLDPSLDEVNNGLAGVLADGQPEPLMFRWQGRELAGHDRHPTETFIKQSCEVGGCGFDQIKDAGLGQKSGLIMVRLRGPSTGC